jgi:hypothetical protein
MYTVGVKRRFWFGYREFEVKAHTWQGDRLVLNLLDGSELHVPGVRSVPIKVYPNFWIHLHSLQAQIPVPAAQVVRPTVKPVQVAPQVVQEEQQDEPPLRDYVRPEVRNAAAERVRGILQSQEFAGSGH